MRMFSGIAVLSGLLLFAPPATAQDGTACGGAERPCTLENGFYHTALPDEPAGAPVVLWLHGYGGKAARAARPKGLARSFTARSYVFVAPQGLPDPARPDQRDWNVADGQDQPRDDVAFLGAVLDDVAARFATDPDRVLLAGFSRGASMAWDFACAQPGRVTGVAAVSGGFWEPMAPTCAGPVNLFHTHGFSDRTVPLEGRKVSWGGVAFHQGNILKGIDVWRAANGCFGAADENLTEGGVWEKRWNGCRNGSLILRLWPGGHAIPKGWSGAVLDWFDTLPVRSG